MTWSPNPLAVGVAAAALALAASGAAAATTSEAPRDCFFSHQWRGWSSTPDGDALYLRVGLHDIYRVELSKGSRAHKWPEQFLVNRVRGASTICSHLDLDLEISDTTGFRRPLIARSIVKLTPEQVAAIPRKDLP